jgi:hypothetical protein
MIPVVFRTPRSLAALNVTGVGMAIAAMTTAAFALGDANKPEWSFIVGVPSLLVGAVWAAMLRRREVTTGMNIPVGWVLSVPLAALNAAFACGLMLTIDAPRILSFVGGMFLGATFGVVLWVPGLLLVLLLFGLPLARARKLARQGLAGEERGEGLVGVVCALLSIAAVVLWHLGVHTQINAFTVLFYAFAWFGLLSGVAAFWKARKREALRRRFIARVEADEVPGLRIETQSDHKMLVRVETHIETYRLPPVEEEEIFVLGLDGTAMRSPR